MAELEQEKEVLLQGLQMMARGRDWYQQQLQRVQERQRRLGQRRASAVSDRRARAGDPPQCHHARSAPRGCPSTGAGIPHSTAPGQQLLGLGSEQELVGLGGPWGAPSGHGGRSRAGRLADHPSAACFQEFGAEGSPRPLGHLLPKVQEVARCLGELLAAACAGTVSPRAPHPPSGRLSRGARLPHGALL